MTSGATVARVGATATGRRHGTFHRLRVSAVEVLTADAVTITFEVPEHLRADYAFEPGQHLTVRTLLDGAEVRRNYSICALAPNGPLRIGVKRLDGGVFSGHATSALAAGDSLDVMTPTGRFTARLDPAQARHYCAVAAGSGITPLLSIVASVLATEPASSVTLLYGNRTAASVMFLDELADLKDRYPQRFRVLHALSREQQGSELLSGRLDPARLRRLLASVVAPETVDEWFLCGPFAMVEGAQEVLAEAGVDAGHVHAELFHVEGEQPRAPVASAPSTPSTPSAPASDSVVTVTLDGRASTMTVPRERRILDAVLAVRADAPYACKGGVCGTCRARVVSGEVSMARNYALDMAEVEAGFVLTCQAVPVSDAVECDFDA